MQVFITDAPLPQRLERGWEGTIVSSPPTIAHPWTALLTDSDRINAHFFATHDVALHGQLTLPPGLAHIAPGLIVTDVDSTLITQEVIEELAEFAGTRQQVTKITARAMNGELDFAESLRQRVATLVGVPASVCTDVLSTITPTQGAQQLIDAVHACGGVFGIVSGGFTQVVAPLAQRMGIDHYVANDLEIHDGVLTGRVSGAIVTRETKVEKLQEWAALHSVPHERTVAVGDGANDVPLLQAAGLGVAFCAKPTVRRQVSSSLDIPALDALIPVLGLV